jgi:hypothetical protein
MSEIIENKLPSKVESVFYHSFMSGLANRMRAWVTNSAFAEYLDVPFIMKWRIDDACGKTPFEDIFEIPENMQYETGRRYQPDETTLWIKKNYPNNNFHDRFIEGNYSLTKEEFQEYVNNQKRHVIPLPFIQKDIDKYTKELDLKNTIGLHIRRTDLKEQHKSPDVWFDQNIQSELNKNPDARFFLATDNKWTEEKFMMKYGDSMVKTERTFNDELDGGEMYPGGHRHRHSPISEGLVDMMLLSKTQKVYGCHGSSFGRFGAWYGGIKFVISDYEE